MGVAVANAESRDTSKKKSAGVKMKRGLFHVGAMVMALTAFSAASVAPAQAAVAQEQGATREVRIEEAGNALMELDESRLYRDADYAGEILGHLDQLRSITEEPDALFAIDSLRLIAFLPLGRSEEARQMLDRVLAWRPNEVHYYISAWWVALSLQDYPRAIAVVELASQVIQGDEWADLRRQLNPQTPWMIIQILREREELTLQARLAEALFRIGWPGGGDIESTDILRKILLDDRLRQGDRAGAADFASDVTTPTTVLPLISLRRYDGLIGSGMEPLARLRRSLAEFDRTTIEAIAGPEPDYGRVLERAQFLLSVNRNAEAWELLEPYTRDVAATVAADRNGMWLNNEAVYVLASLGREREALDLSRRLAAIPLENNTSLIGPRINHASNLNAAGLHEEALDYARQLETESSQVANEYGRMLIWRAIVCALAAQGRPDEAASTMERMQAGDAVNPLARIDAHLCLNDPESAEARLVSLLESDDPVSAIILLQNYELDAERPARYGQNASIGGMRDRPAVRAALERVGYLRTLPLARGAWRW